MQLTKDSLVRVRVSSEDAGGISMSAVQNRDVAAVELATWIVSVTGKDAPRVVEILERGSFVLGLSRMRWEPLEAVAESVPAIFDLLPDDWPERPFDAHAVREIVVTAGMRKIAIPGAAANARRWFRSESFLGRWLKSAALPPPSYERYDYREKADRFRGAIPPETLSVFREAADLLPSGTLRNALRSMVPTGITLWLDRH